LFNFIISTVFALNLKRLFFFFIVLICFIFKTNGQNVSLYNQFNGRYDFTFIGNTMNTAENNPSPGYVTNTSSTATLSLNSGDVIEKAYLYWAGSGDGDFEVNLNSEVITPDRTFSLFRVFGNLIFTYFSAFKDITTLIQTTGNGDYTLSNLDISAFEELHFQRKTNFAGWAIVIIYKNDVLPLNQVNIYDGLQGVPDELSITLSSLNVIDDNNSKVGFVAWEGDSGLATEEFRMNGTLLSSALSPLNNVFNGTNSITDSSTLYNMDLDIYDIQNNIGDANAKQVALVELQQKADVLSLHIPWTPETNGLVNRDFIQAFTKPFWLINTSRGKNVVTADLVLALKSGKILGAGLDATFLATFFLTADLAGLVVFFALLFFTDETFFIFDISTKFCVIYKFLSRKQIEIK
jgi:hypothetical protein